jgi:hypothetical protein
MNRQYKSKRKHTHKRTPKQRPDVLGVQKRRVTDPASHIRPSVSTGSTNQQPVCRPRQAIVAIGSKWTRNWTRYLRTSWGQRIYAFFLPFTARPSQFVQRKVHPVYGKISGIPFAPLIPASWIFAKANVTMFEAHITNDFWQGKSATEIISLNNDIVNLNYLIGFIFVFLLIHAVSSIKYLWHLGVRKITDKTRNDGQISSPVPLKFFIFHTSGLAWWLGVYMLAFSFITKFFPSNPFTTIYNFFEENLLWKGAAGTILIFLLVKYYESNTQIFMEIYRNDNLVKRVRIASLIFVVGLGFSLPIAFGFWLLNKASIMQGSLVPSCIS